ncbi:MAG: hypothetical protein LBH19_04685 [Dysgonamonadaceae bacterium]|jgi:hypothetical protein|nr:hypothetical protein [Dysgonamonadaceae bacterium]
MDKKKILYFDMDNVLVDFRSGIDRLSKEIQCEYEGRLDEVPGIFSLMEPMSGAVEAVNLLSQYFDVYILSTAPWKNPSAWTDKANWVHKYFGIEKDAVFYKRLIISHRKDLNRGDYLIDDRTKNGAGEFQGELIRFGSEQFPDWEAILNYLLSSLCQCFSESYFGFYLPPWSSEGKCLGFNHSLDSVPDVNVYTCAHCGRKWIAILDDGRYGQGEDNRWFRTPISEEDLKSIEPDTVMQYMLKKRWCKYGGPYYKYFKGEKYDFMQDKISILSLYCEEEQKG